MASFALIWTTMSFDWAEYLSVAETLCGLPASGPIPGVEAHQRAGVSRAYYAGYVSARNRLRDIDQVLIPATVNPHIFVANEYAKSGDTVRAQIGIELSRLRRDRNRCDYDDIILQLSQLTRRSLVRAAAVLTDLKRL